MANKWNTTDIEKISTAFTQKNLQKCFQENEMLSGEQIASATDFPQINYFVLREIFSQWEEETGRLKSPYFDFDAPEVQRSFTDFRNTLSRHIRVSATHFEPLLQAAVSKTLELYMRPETFFVADFRKLPDFKLTREWLHKNQVFFKSHDWLIRDLGQAVEGEFIYANQALEEVKNLLQNHPHDFSEEVKQIAEAAGLQPSPPEPVHEPENDNLSFFERLVANPPKPTTEFRDPDISPFDRIAQRVKTEVPRPEIAREPAFSEPPAEVAAEVNPLEVQELPVEISQPTPVRTEVVQTRTVIQEETRSVFEGLNIPTLNDKLSAEERTSLADAHQRSRIESLKGSMTLNQRFSFLNSLFGGDLNTFEEALRQVEQCTSLAQASELLEMQYAEKNNWHLRADDVQEFMDLVKRRLG